MNSHPVSDIFNHPTATHVRAVSDGNNPLLGIMTSDRDGDDALQRKHANSEVLGISVLGREGMGKIEANPKQIVEPLGAYLDR